MLRIEHALAAAAVTAGALLSGCATTWQHSSHERKRTKRCGTCKSWDNDGHKTHPLKQAGVARGGGLDDDEHLLLAAYDDSARAASASIRRLCDVIPASERAAMDARFAELAHYYEARLVADIESQSFAAFLVRCQDYLPRCRVQLAMREGEEPDPRTRDRLDTLGDRVHYAAEHTLTPDSDRILKLVHNDGSFHRALRSLNAAHAAGSPTLDERSPVASALQRWRRRIQLRSLEAQVAGSDASELAQLRESVESARRARHEAEQSSAASLDHALDAGVSAGNAKESAREADEARDAARAAAAKDWAPPTAREPRAESPAPPPEEPRKRTVR